MSRSKSLRRTALRWKIVGGLAFLLGVFMLYQKAYYESRDFYADNFELYQHEMTLIKLDQQSSSELAIAMKEMQESRYWEAVTHLENLKLQSPAVDSTRGLLNRSFRQLARLSF